jgi:DNA (cytosine-5)-methyltransferase 1
VWRGDEGRGRRRPGRGAWGGLAVETPGEAGVDCPAMSRLVRGVWVSGVSHEVRLESEQPRCRRMQTRLFGRSAVLAWANSAKDLAAQPGVDSLLLSLFCGAGGLDHGFEEAGFKVGLALDRKRDSVDSYNLNRPMAAVAKVQDLADITVHDIDKLYGREFKPTGVIGGPPCQSFSQANVNQRVDDVRIALPVKFAELLAALHVRQAMDFFVMENVVGLTLRKHQATLEAVEAKLHGAGFNTARLMLNAKDYDTPQNRPRLFLVGVNKRRFPAVDPTELVPPTTPQRTVRQAIGALEEPTHFVRGVDMSSNKVHVNHWCMAPKSPKFHQDGGVKPGVKGRSFKVLEWDAPSIAVAYGHREVNVHPSGRRRLSVYEAMLLQGFPKEYKLVGTLSSQIDQVSEAVPPTLAYAVASTIRAALCPVELERAG